MFAHTLLLALSGAVFFFLQVPGMQSFPPPLPKAEEQKLFLSLREHPEQEEIRRKLIIHNLRLVSHIVRKYYGSHSSQEDLVSIGSIGLIKAVDTFSPANGARFATYAARCIQNAILTARNADPGTSVPP